MVKLDINAMVHGIGRKATGEELLAYFLEGKDKEPICLEVAFAELLKNNNNKQNNKNKKDN